MAAEKKTSDSTKIEYDCNFSNKMYQLLTFSHPESRDTDKIISQLSQVLYQTPSMVSSFSTCLIKEMKKSYGLLNCFLMMTLQMEMNEEFSSTTYDQLYFFNSLARDTLNNDECPGNSKIQG